MQNDIVDNLFIDMNKEKSRAVVYCRQGDTLTRTIHIRLTDHGIPYDLTNLLFAEMFIVKPDGTECDNPMIRVDNELHYTYKTNDLAVEGECVCQVMLTFEDGAVVTSPEFTTFVYKKTINQKKLISTNSYTALTEMVVQANSYANNASQSADVAKAYKESAMASMEEAIKISEGVEEFVNQAKEYALSAEESKTNASNSAESAAQSESNARVSETNAGRYAENARTNAELIESKISDAVNAANASSESADKAYQSEIKSKEYEESAYATIEVINAAAEETRLNKDAAAVSEANAKTSEDNASTYAANAKASETNAAKSESNARVSETNAESYAQNASVSASSAASSATSAGNSKNSAAVSATNASASESAAKQSELNSAASEQEAQKYAEQVKAISEGFSGALKPLGTITFADLPSVESATAGDMYNISNEFTTDSSFKEGAGVVVSAGTNVYLTSDNYWDCLAGSPVTGVKGNAESGYRRGNVNITPAGIGLGNVTNHKQVRGLSSGTTQGHVVVFGADGYLVSDSGHTIEENVPPGAQFTDTHCTTGLKVGASSTAKANEAATNGNVYLIVLDDDVIRDIHNIVGSGATTVVSDENGNITISSTNTKNSAGASNKASTKMFLVGATSQTNGITSYSNSKCYIGTDNALYSEGKKVALNEDLAALIERVEQLEDTIGYPIADEEVTT